MEANQKLQYENQSLRLKNNSSIVSSNGSDEKKMENIFTNKNIEEALLTLKQEHIKEVLAYKAEIHDLIARSESQEKIITKLTLQFKNSENNNQGLVSTISKFEKEIDNLNMSIQKIKIAHTVDIDEIE